MKIVAGLGNPGPEYDDTRHNVGWWVVDRLAHDWGLGAFERRGAALTVEGTAAGERVRLLKPLTFMNRSGAALAGLPAEPEVSVPDDLLVVVDDAALDVGRVRFRPGGGSGGHRGLESVEAALGTDAYARLRVGVGPAPPDADLAAWVLSPVPARDEAVIVRLLPDLTAAVELWIAEGIGGAMDRYNGKQWTTSEDT